MHMSRFTSCNSSQEVEVWQAMVSFHSVAKQRTALAGHDPDLWKLLPPGHLLMV